MLQGGGALGAYQAGVYEALTEAGFAPDWVTGVSIGAINAALIAGNPPERRVERLREFWDRVSSGIPLIAPRRIRSPAPHLQSRFRVGERDVRRPGFLPSARSARRASRRKARAAALSVYDTSPLRETLTELVEFDRINERDDALRRRRRARASGNSIYFDNYAPDTRDRAGARDGERRAAAGVSAGRDRATSTTGTAASSPIRRCGTCSTTARTSKR